MTPQKLWTLYFFAIALPQRHEGTMPPLVLQLHRHLCDTPFCNISCDSCATPNTNIDHLIIVFNLNLIKGCNPPGLLQESLGPFGPEVSRECPSGCLWGPSGPGLRSGQKVSPECPRSVKKVSGDSGDTLETLWGHFLDTPEPGARRAPETPRGTLPGHFGPRDSCSRPGGLQIKGPVDGGLERRGFPIWTCLFRFVLFVPCGLSADCKGAGGKGPRQKTSKIVKKCQKVFRHFSTIFAQGKRRQNRQKLSKIFSTIFARHQFSGPFWGALRLSNDLIKNAGVLSQFKRKLC